MSRGRQVVTGTSVIPVIDEGLGNSAYLVAIGDGRALAVDVPRDLRVVRAAARRHGLSIAFAADTHLHADFLSGARQLAADDGAQIVAAARGGRDYVHRGLSDGDEIDLGGLMLRAWATPGHTGEHLAYLLVDGQKVLASFTGGSLLVGSAARTDLAGEEQAESLARLQYKSLHRLMTLPDETIVYPTHGAGSFCSSPPGAERTTTIGTERATNHLLAIGDEETFVETLLRTLGSFPPYFLRLAEQNRLGPAVLSSAPAIRPVLPRQVSQLSGEGAEIVDVRPVASYAAGHIPGSLAIPLSPAFATWLGWLIPDPGTALVIVAEPGQDIADVAWQAVKIGYENLAGQLSGGVAGWKAAGKPLATTELATAARTDPASVIDVRQSSEYAGGHLPGAMGIELGNLPSQAADLPPGPVVTMCGHGERAATAASVLERAGRSDVAILRGAPEGWQRATGLQLEVSV
jgi:rhodanese-related sulfurtransferase/glyoxylase-like metal-dependent hydrolase (beta-lactamase superfamily II)